MTDEGPSRPAGEGPREAALGVLKKLVAAGYTAYFAGGCVRDRLMGRAPKDHDIATDARPEAIRALFPRAQSVGESFGVMLVRRRGHTIEVATFRSEGDYRDGRHPEHVVFGDDRRDAERRDFTINGLFENPLTGEIIDYVGGRADIAARRIRAIGDPAARIREDRLRTLRAIRFAARFQFAIDQETADAIRAAGAELRGVSRERIGQEVRWMLVDPNRAVAVWEMHYLGLDEAVLNEPAALCAPLRLGRLPAEVAYPTALAAWILDRRDRHVFEIREAVGRWVKALVLSGAEGRGLQETLEVHRVLRDAWWRQGVAAQKRLAASECFDEGLRLIAAEDPQAFVDLRRHVLSLAETGIAPPPLINGDDLIAAGMRPSPAFRRVLDGVYDAQLEGAIGTREEAMALAEAIMGQEGGGQRDRGMEGQRGEGSE